MCARGRGASECFLEPHKRRRQEVSSIPCPRIAAGARLMCNGTERTLTRNSHSCASCVRIPWCLVVVLWSLHRAANLVVRPNEVDRSDVSHEHAHVGPNHADIEVQGTAHARLIGQSVLFPFSFGLETPSMSADRIRSCAEAAAS